MSKRFLRVVKKLVVGGLPVAILALTTFGAFGADGKSGAKVFRPKAVKSKIQAATGVAIVNAASYLPGICPGGIASIFGAGLSTITTSIGATTDPLPYQIADVTVYVNGVPAPLYVVAYSNGADQINFQVPYATPVGLVANNAGVQIDVYSNGVPVSSTLVDSYTEDPGIFIYDQDNIEYAIAVHLPDYALITPDDPAIPGEYIVLYTTGLGPLTVDILDGYGAPSDPLAYTQDPFQAVINGEVCVENAAPGACNILFSGLAPGLVGLYQLNLQLPADLAAGTLPIQILTAYSNSGVAYLPTN